MAKWSAGLALSATNLDLVVLRRDRAGAAVAWSHREHLGLAKEAGPEAYRPGVEKALAKLKEWQGLRFVPVQVALPDPVVRAHLFRLTDLPGSDQALNQLISWRMAREYGLGEGEHVFTYQQLSPGSRDVPVLGLGAPKSWVAMIRETFRQERLAPVVIDAGALYRLNWAGSRLQGNASWLFLDRDAWAFLVWDGDMGPRYLHAGWRQEEPLESLGDYLAGNIEQVLKAQQMPDPENPVERLYITAGEGEASALEAQLKERDVPPPASLAFSDLPLNRSGGTLIPARATAELR